MNDDAMTVIARNNDWTLEIWKVNDSDKLVITKCGVLQSSLDVDPKKIIRAWDQHYSKLQTV